MEYPLELQFENSKLVNNIDRIVVFEFYIKEEVIKNIKRIREINEKKIKECL